MGGIGYRSRAVKWRELDHWVTTLFDMKRRGRARVVIMIALSIYRDDPLLEFADCPASIQPRLRQLMARLDELDRAQPMLLHTRRVSGAVSDRPRVTHEPAAS